MSEEWKNVCLKCGRKMIKRYTGIVLDSNPPQHPWYWWCGCGNKEKGNVDVGMTEKQLAYYDWRKKNNLPTKGSDGELLTNE